MATPLDNMNTSLYWVCVYINIYILYTHIYIGLGFYMRLNTFFKFLNLYKLRYKDNELPKELDLYPFDMICGKSPYARNTDKNPVVQNGLGIENSIRYKYKEGHAPGGIEI